MEEQGRLPQHGEDRDIFERLYAVRLDRLRQSEECRAVLEPLDSRGLLTADANTSLTPQADLDDEALLASLGIDAAENDALSIWLLNQIYGYTVRQYPWSADSLFWGFMLGLGTLVVAALALLRPPFSQKTLKGHCLGLGMVALIKEKQCRSGMRIKRKP